uniref:AP-4 complex subunit beta-1-like n=1 Tax=Styela clava TaxID=7725 RepID=UPI00193AD513|nr:AP-4 complex subunit beta-1-like [Styela clava]
MNYDSSHDISRRLSKELSTDLNRNSQAILEILKDLLRMCDGELLESTRVLNSVIQLTQVKDVRVKKIVYLYLSFVGEHDSEIWLHITNSISNDLLEPNPFVRKAAILILTDSHSISSLLNETRINSITNCLKDNNPSVRRYAVAGIGKLYRLFSIQKVEFDTATVFDKLVQMIYVDEDPTVIVECIRCLQLGKKHEVKTELLISLLERMDMVEEWTKMEIVVLFTKCSNPLKMTHEEIFQVLNILDPHLDDKNPIFFTLSCATAMLHVSKRFAKIYSDVKTRIVDFLISQLALVTLPMQSLHLIMLNELLDKSSNSKLFPYWKKFLLLSTDDAFLKVQKLKILSRTATTENVLTIFRHITGIIMTAIESELIFEAVDSLTVLHQHLPSNCETFLQSILKHDNTSIVDSALVALWKIQSDLKDKELSIDSNTLMDEVVKIYRKLSCDYSKVAFLSLVCTFSRSKPHMKIIMKILKQEIATWSHISDYLFKLVLLRSAFIFYFIFPKSFQTILGEIMHLMSSENNLILNRHAMMYYTFLKTNVEAAKTFASDLSKEFSYQFPKHFTNRSECGLRTLQFLKL